MNSKELAKKLGVSESAVSFALNSKPGISTETRNRILEAAEKEGLKIRKNRRSSSRSIYLIYCRKHGAVLAETSFFSELSQGVTKQCNESGVEVHVLNILGIRDLRTQLTEIVNLDVDGIMLIATELSHSDIEGIDFKGKPVLLLDNNFIGSGMNAIEINNREGGYIACNYLIDHYHVHPGYLKSTYRIHNFRIRHEGFDRSLREHGISTASTNTYELAPSMDGACEDTKALLEGNERFPRCLFAENDLIAIGAMKAMKEYGIRIPEDVAIIGFDDIPMCSYVEPALTTVHVPKHHMGTLAVGRLLDIIERSEGYPLKVDIGTSLIIRKSA